MPNIRKLFLSPRARNAAILAALVLIALLLVIDSPLAMQGAREGLALCGQVVIPSLYPFFVLGGLFAQVQRRRHAALGAVLFGLLGGYPMGAKTAAQLMERGLVTRAQARRLQLFCVNAGPAYLIGAVGVGLLGSRRAGVILLVSMTLASLTLGLCARFLLKDDGEAPLPLPPEQPAKGFDQKLLGAVTQATGAILGVCAWVVLFSALCALLRRLPVGMWPAIPALNVLLEVSSGAAAVVRTGTPLPVLCAALGWGGLSVHCQILGDIKKTGLPLRLFWASRLLHGGLAAAICAQLMKWFPLGVSAAVVAGSQVHMRLWTVSAPAAAAALFFCAFMILELDLNRKVC